MYEWNTISEMTSGRANRQILNNWTTRGLWATRLDDAENGKPRSYSRMNVVEAVVADEMMRIGISREQVRAFFRWRALRAGGGDGGWAVEIDALPEMRPGSDEWWWICLLMSEDGRQRTECPPFAVHGGAALAERIGALAGRALVVVDIAGVVRRVDAALSEIDAASVRT